MGEGSGVIWGGGCRCNDMCIRREGGSSLAASFPASFCDSVCPCGGEVAGGGGFWGRWGGGGREDTGVLPRDSQRKRPPLPPPTTKAATSIIYVGQMQIMLKEVARGSDSSYGWLRKKKIEFN